MKKYIILLISLIIISTSLLACNKQQAAKQDQIMGDAAAHKHNHAAMLQEDTFKGKVTQTMDSGGYTYIAISKDGKKIWAATQLTKVAVGDNVEFMIDMPMTNFTSNTLNRTFDKIYFVKPMQAAVDSNAALPANHPNISGLNNTAAPAASSAPAPVVVAAGSVKKAGGGYTVAEVFAQKAQLSGKNVAIRGKVVKFTPEIMGTNWVHIKDGTGSSGSDDLTITTLDTAAVGDTVIATGTLAIDKDFGASYKYSAIVETAKLVVEK